MRNNIKLKGKNQIKQTQEKLKKTIITLNVSRAQRQILKIQYKVLDNFVFQLQILQTMPELPEVETVRRFLQEVLLKPKPKKIKHIFTYYPTIIKEPEPAQFVKILIGQSFQAVDRYGKFLIFKLQKNSIISHLRMEGKYNFYPQRPEIGKHDHIQFVMSDGSALVYLDVRKFGTMHLVLKGQEMEHKSLIKLGPEANQSEFTPEYLQEICQSRTSSIKELLLDQDSVCGIGNIYADQILYSSGIHPQTSAKSLPIQKLKQIVNQSKYILDKAIINRGTTFRSFSSNNQQGQFQNCLKVYDRAGQRCEKCGHNIQKIKVGGRGTHFCPKCQLKYR